MLLAVALTVALASPAPAGPAPVQGTESPMGVICNMIEQPDERDDVLMQFKLANWVPVAIDRVWIRIWEPDFVGLETSVPSVVQLDGGIAKNGTVTRLDSVKAPPGFRMTKFASLSCAIFRVRFTDGTEWQSLDPSSDFRT